MGESTDRSQEFLYQGNIRRDKVRDSDHASRLFFAPERT
jgi:hypothetical protein